MTYKQSKEYLVNDLVPNAWKTVLENKRNAEILLYKLILKCMQTCSDVSIEFYDNPIVKVIRSWIADDTNDLGTNAIYLHETETGTVIVGCYFDISKLREDLEVLATDLFGTIDFSKIDEEKIENLLNYNDNTTNEIMDDIRIESPSKRIRNNQSESK